MFNARMVMTAVSICYCLGSGIGTANGQSRSGQPLPVEKSNSILVIPSDASLGDAIQGAHAVVLVRANKRIGTRIVDRRPDLMRANPSVVLPEPLPVPVTEYEVTPTEVLKPYPGLALGSVMRLASRGGAAPFNGVTIHEDSRTPPLIGGRQYLLFLTFSESIAALLITPFGVFDVTGPTVVANEYLLQTPFGRELSGLTPQQALRRVRIILADPQR